MFYGNSVSQSSYDKLNQDLAEKVEENKSLRKDMISLRRDHDRQEQQIQVMQANHIKIVGDLQKKIDELSRQMQPNQATPPVVPTPTPYLQINPLLYAQAAAEAVAKNTYDKLLMLLTPAAIWSLLKHLESSVAFLPSWSSWDLPTFITKYDDAVRAGLAAYFQSVKPKLPTAQELDTYYFQNRSSNQLPQKRSFPFSQPPSNNRPPPNPFNAPPLFGSPSNPLNSHPTATGSSSSQPTHVSQMTTSQLQTFIQQAMMQSQNPLNGRAQMMNNTSFLDSSTVARKAANRETALAKIQSFIEGKLNRGFSFKTIRSAFDLQGAVDPKDRQKIVTTFTAFKTYIQTNSFGDSNRRSQLVTELDKVINIFAGLETKNSVGDAMQQWQQDFQTSGILFNTALQLSAAVARRVDINSSFTPQRKTNGLICWYCKEPGHTKNECPHQYSDDPIEPSRICNAFNTPQGCRKGPRCKYLHICSKCRKIHRQHPAHKCQA